MIFPQVLLSLTIVFLFMGGPALDGFAEDTTSSTKRAAPERSLTDLIHEYLMVSDSNAAQVALQNILHRPDVTLASVSEALKQPIRYAQQPVGSLNAEEITVRGRQYQYSLYVPSLYDSAKAYPLIVCLHGAGFTGKTYLDRWVPRLNDRYILVCPTVGGMGAWWTRSAEELVLEIIKSIQARYHVDQNQIFLTGMSNGGIGAWIIGMHHADVFAGVAPMASGIDDVLFPFLDNLRLTAIYVIHGVHDQVMPVSLSRSLVHELKDRGIRHMYREHQFTHPHAGGHFFPREELPALIAWFDKQQRSPISQRVSMVRDATHLEPLSWVRIDATDRIAAFSENLIDRRDELIVGKVYAKLDAKIHLPNHIEVTTKHVKQYSLFFNEDLIDFSQPVTIETNGHLSFHGHVTPSVETLLRQSRLRQDPNRLLSVQLTVDVLE